MKNLLDFVSRRSFLLGSLLILSLVLLVSLPDRALQSDENWFGEQAYWLLHEGQVKLKSIPYIFDWDEVMPVHHKLLTWSGSAIIYIFGWSVYPLRIFILLLALITFYVMYKYVKTRPELTTKHYLVAMILMLITPEFINRIFFFRPEILVMCFGFASFYFLNYSSHKHLLSPLLAGFFAGLAFVSHLTAVIFPVAGFFILLLQKQWKPLITYTVVGIAICLIYTEGLWSEAGIEQYLYELKNWPSHGFEEKVDGGIFYVIWNNVTGLLDEHKRYFWDQDIWLISGLFFLTLIFHLGYLFKAHKTLIQFTLMLMLLMGLVNGSHGPRYLVYLFPYMTLIIAIGIKRAWSKQWLAQQTSYLIVLCVQLAILTMAYVKIFNEKIDIDKYSDTVLGKIEAQAHVIGPWDLIYNNIADYHIYNFKTYEYLEEGMEKPFSQLELLKDLNNRGVDYIVINKQLQSDNVMHWFKDWQIIKNEYYVIDKKSSEYLILKRKNL